MEDEISLDEINNEPESHTKPDNKGHDNTTDYEKNMRNHEVQWNREGKELIESISDNLCDAAKNFVTVFDEWKNDSFLNRIKDATTQGICDRIAIPHQFIHSQHRAHALAILNRYFGKIVIVTQDASNNRLFYATLRPSSISGFPWKTDFIDQMYGNKRRGMHSSEYSNNETDSDTSDSDTSDSDTSDSDTSDSDEDDYEDDSDDGDDYSDVNKDKDSRRNRNQSTNRNQLIRVSKSNPSNGTLSLGDCDVFFISLIVITLTVYGMSFF